MKAVYKLSANLIFLLHFFIVIVAVFGWLVPSIWWFYMSVLVLTLLSDIVFGYCILSKWEFDLRKKLDPNTNYNFTWTTFYTYKLTNHRISDPFYKRAAIIAISAVILINLYFKFWH
jgi:hypothetical protein